MTDTQSKSLACILYRQAKQMTKEQLRKILFFDKETLDNWSLKKCQLQYVIDQLEWIEGGNDELWEAECNEIWQEIELTKFFHICEVY